MPGDYPMFQVGDTNTTRLLKDTTQQMKAAPGVGSYIARGIRGTAALPIAAGADVLDALKPAGAAVMNFGSELATGTPYVPPSAAANAAKAAAVRSSGSDPTINTDAYNRSGAGDNYPAYPTPGSTTERAAQGEKSSVDAWNQHVAQQLGTAGTAGTPAEVASLMAGSQPGWGKQAGLDAINAPGGKPRMLNVGYGSTIIGSGSTTGAGQSGPNKTLGRANSFTGIGTGDVPEGAAGVFGAPPPGSTPSPIEKARAHVNDLYKQAEMYSKSGTLWGKIQAAGLYKRAAAMHASVMGEGTIAHAMGQLNLDTQKAAPDIAARLAAQKLMEAGDTQGAWRVLSTAQGHNPDALQFHTTALGGIAVNPAGEGIAYDLQNNPKGRLPRMADLPMLQPPTALPGR